MRISVDIGFGFVKVMNEHGKTERFPSVLAKRPETSLRGIIGSSGDDYAITYWEEAHNGDKLHERNLFVGDAGITNGGTRKWEDKKAEFNEEELKILISTAVSLLNPNNEEIDLCVGLPMSYYLDKKDELIDLLSSINAKVAFVGQPNAKSIRFKTVYCFPQGAGAYYSAVFDIKGDIKNYEIGNSSVGVIDIGFRTVDFLVMGKGRKGVTLIDTLSGSLEEDGMNKAYQEVERTLSETVGREIGLIEVEKAILWFGSKLDYRKETLHLTEHEENAYRGLAESITAKIKQKWGAEGDMLSTIIITGGGGQDLYPVLKEKFEQAELQENPAFSNCEGYLGAQARKFKRG